MGNWLFGGSNVHDNENLTPYLGMGYDLYGSEGKSGKAENMVNKYLGMYKKGMAGDLPFLKSLDVAEGAEMQDLDRSNPDTAFAANPEMAARVKMLNKNRVSQNYGNQRVSMASNMLSGLLGMSNEFRTNRYSLQNNTLGNLMNAVNGGRQYTQQPGAISGMADMIGALTGSGGVSGQFRKGGG